VITRSEERGSPSAGSADGRASTHFGEAENRHLLHLYEISKLLTGSRNAEETVPAICTLATAAVPLRAAVLVLEENPRATPRAIAWQAPHSTPMQLAAVRERAQAAFAYLKGDAAAPPSASDPALQGAASGADARGPPVEEAFIVLPMVVSRGQVFGALQLQATAALDEADLLFLSALVNQLAVALDREATVRARQADAESRRSTARTEQLRAEVSRASAEARELEARAMSERYQALVDNLDHAFVWVADAHTLRTSYVSARAEELLGVPLAEWRARPFLANIARADRDEARRVFNLVRVKRKDASFDARFVCRDGRLCWFHTGVHLTADTPTPQLQGVSVDITALKEASARAHKQAEFNRAVTTSIEEGVLAVDMEDRVSFLNPAAGELLGCDPSVAVGKESAELFSVRRSDRVPLDALGSPTAQVIETGIPFGADDQLFERADRTTFPVSYRAAPLEHDGGIIGAVLVFRDILELQRSETLHRFLADVGPVLATSLDHRSTLAAVVRLSVPLLADLCFIDELQADGRVDRVEILFADPDKQRLADRVRASAPHQGWPTPHGRALRGGDSILIPLAIPPAIARDEAESTLMREYGLESVMIVPLRARGRVLGTITFAAAGSGRIYAARDLELAEEIARRAAYAIDNARLYEQAQSAVRARDEVLALVSHDLRDPLSGIVLHTTLLRTRAVADSLGARSLQGIESIERLAGRMERMLRDLMDVGSIDAGRLTIDKDWCDVAALLDEVKEAHQPAASRKQLQLVCEPPPRQLRICCDRERILQVLGNLIGNAIKFSQEGTIWVGTALGDGELVFSVSDNGPGIQSADLPHIFEHRWQVRATARLGSGLGLTIVKGLVEAHGGRVWVTSQVGAGSNFFFSLPLPTLRSVGD
jgi:PAS domain S-box-containing protein